MIQIVRDFANDVVSQENTDFFMGIRQDYDTGCNRFVM